MAPRRESVFAVGNGYLGIRGAPEEGAPSHDPGVILNGLARNLADPLSRGRPRAGAGWVRRSSTPPTARSTVSSSTTSPWTWPPLGLKRFERVLDLRHRRAEPRGGMGDRARPPRADPLAPTHLARAIATWPRWTTRSIALDEHVRIANLLRAGDPRSRPDRGRPAAREGLRREGARAARGPRGRGRAPSCSSRPATADSRWRAAWSTTSSPRPRSPSTQARRGTASALVVLAELEPGASLRLSKYVAYHWASQAPAGDLVARVDRTLDRAGRPTIRRD